MIKLQKSEFRETILLRENKNIKQLIVSEQDLHKDTKGIEWKENNKEVVINNKYHEVLSVTRQGNKCIVNVIEDELENSLFLNFFDNSRAGERLADTINVFFELNFELPLREKFGHRNMELYTYRPLSVPDHSSDFFSRIIKPPGFITS